MIGRRHRIEDILVFVSLAERYVEIIADHATHAWRPDGIGIASSMI